MSGDLVGPNHPAEVLYMAQKVTELLTHFVQPVDPARDARADASEGAKRVKAISGAALVEGRLQKLPLVREQES